MILSTPVKHLCALHRLHILYTTSLSLTPSRRTYYDFSFMLFSIGLPHMFVQLKDLLLSLLIRNKSPICLKSFTVRALSNPFKSFILATPNSFIFLVSNFSSSVLMMIINLIYSFLLNIFYTSYF